MKRTLRTVDEVIDAFGGNEVVGEWLGVGRTAVCNWRSRGFPTGVQLRIWLQAQELGYRIDLKVFGAEPWPSIRELHGPRHQVSVA